MKNRCIIFVLILLINGCLLSSQIEAGVTNESGWYGRNKYPTYTAGCEAIKDFWCRGNGITILKPYTNPAVKDRPGPHGMYCECYSSSHYGHSVLWSTCDDSSQNTIIANSGCLPANNPKEQGKPEHCIGNPINLATGNKFQVETDYQSTASQLVIRRYYNSQSDNSSVVFNNFGWRFEFDSKLWVNDGKTNIILYRPNGKEISFALNSGSWITDPDLSYQLSLEDIDGQSYWKVITDKDVIELFYYVSGRLYQRVEPNGYTQTLQYEGADGTGHLTQLDDSFQRKLQFTHVDSNNLAITLPDNSIIKYEYGSPHGFMLLSSVTYSDNDVDDNNNPKRTYHYENGELFAALTGITDENGNRYATWTYDDQGRAISSEHANGVDKVTIDYTYLEDDADSRATVTNALGKQTTYHFATIQGVRKVTQVEGYPTATCEGANKSYSYDANGNIISKTDWNGVVTTYTYDMDRNLELSRTEAVGTPQERTITTEWHAQFRLPTRITEPDRITEYTYDAQGRRLTSKTSSVQ